jgi:D-serine deaminase-like pyridoxal phosphate-dependent protein
VQELSAQCCCHLQLELGEGVRWDDRSGELAWMDVHRGRLHTARVTSPGLGRLDVLDIGGPLTAVGDILAFGISHPCTTFDKWRVIPVVDDTLTVTDCLTTCF